MAVHSRKTSAPSGASTNSKTSLGVQLKRPLDKEGGLGIKLMRPVQAKKYSLPKEGVVAAGKYSSIIVDIKLSKTRARDDAVDVLYNFEDGANRIFHVLQRYPLDSVYYAELVDALLNAGLSEEDDITKAIGIRENIVLAYSDDSPLGSITARTPAGAKSTARKVTVNDLLDDAVDDEDDEAFEDFREDYD